MSKRVRTAVGAISVLSITMTAILWNWRWQVSQITGDVKVHDTGQFWSYPRYTFEFPEIDASRSGSSRFHIGGLPQFPLTFSLGLIDCVPTRNCKLTVQIRDSSGDVVHQASDLASDWVWHRGGNTSDLWHPKLRDLRLRRKENYIVEIRYEIVGDHSETHMLVPQLKGGGNELP